MGIQTGEFDGNGGGLMEDRYCHGDLNGAEDEHRD